MMDEVYELGVHESPGWGIQEATLEALKSLTGVKGGFLRLRVATWSFVGSP